MAVCRVYLFTYKRNELLPRAIKSLQNQTFTNWICELHNDCPEDDFPGSYLKTLNDERFSLHNHTQNLGAVLSFNYAYSGCTEQYASMLEDDNWWEPTFLEEMIDLMERNSDIKIAWSNMKLWQEKNDSSWEDTRKTTWPVDQLISRFSWPQPRQAMGAMHSNGALLYRGALAKKYAVPGSTLFNAIELIRERAFEHPIYLVHKPLANFAVTKETNRSTDPLVWIGSQVMLLATFVLTSPSPESTFTDSLSCARGQRPTPVANYFLANLLIIKKSSFYLLLKPADWLVIGKWLVKNGVQLTRLKQYLADQDQVYQFLLKETSARYKEQFHENSI